MVTAGANQAFVNIVLSLVDESDTVVLFKPYYFNHIMALQMTGGADRVGLRVWGFGMRAVSVLGFGARSMLVV
jgi:DNA-binding transcriptional MocR family regulator